MDLQLIRNATLKLSAAERTILVDPYFAPRFSRPSFTGVSPNPLVDLPLPVAEILRDIELVIVSHLHSDHFDPVAHTALDKRIPIICQPGDEDAIRDTGFLHVVPLMDQIEWRGLLIRRRAGSHGLGPVIEEMGQVMGFTLEAPGEPRLYWLGDTVLYPPIEQTIAAFRPDVIVTHSCAAYWGADRIVMDDEETIGVCKSAPEAVVVATHMDALDHATIDRRRLRAAADRHGISHTRLLIPQDGETLKLGAAPRFSGHLRGQDVPTGPR